MARRQQLARDYASAEVSLSIYLATCLVEAAADLPDRPAGELFEQFLGWLGPPFDGRFPRLPGIAGPARWRGPTCVGR
jgi:hypothetical protein